MATRYRYALNPYRDDALLATLVPPAPPDVREFHRSLPGYRVTPLVALPGLAAELDLAAVWVKDEGHRCGLGAFKALGASYAIHRALGATPNGIHGRTGRDVETFAAATDGNHGRAVAWTARTLGHRSVIFLPRSTAPARIAAIRGEGAEIVEVDGTYDDAVRQVAEQSAARGWHVVSDTAYAGNMEIPRWIMAGYETVFAEAAEQLAGAGAPDPTVVFLQAGVGGFAGAGVCFHARRRAPRPRLVAVVPTEADAFLESIGAPGGEIRPARGRQDSIMAGLNCGTPSLAAWPILRAGIDLFLAVDDGFAQEAMRALAAGRRADPSVVAGESGAAGCAGLLALRREPGLRAAREAIGLGVRSRVLVVNTEGATDPVGYSRIVGLDPERLADDDSSRRGAR